MLTIRDNVKLNGPLSKVVWDLAPYAGNVLIDITSGLREPLDQLHLIGWYAIQKEVKYPEFDVHNLYDKITLGDGIEVYTWQRTWSRLLHQGVIINPPFAAVCLEDSYRPDHTNRKGQVIQGSPHSHGTAFDISGAHGIEPVVLVLEQAKAAGVAIKNWLVERENNCVHVNISS
jgi:hypothetical protein